MTSKIIISKPVRCENHHVITSSQMSRSFGKPSKPRCNEPSMFEILSWKDENKEEREHQVNQVNYHGQFEYKQPEQVKKIVQCKSLPQEQFVRSTHNYNLSREPGLEESYANASNEYFKTQNPNYQTDNTLNQQKKSQSLKKKTHSSQYFKSQKHINMGDTQIPPKNSYQFTKEIPKLSHQYKDQPKAKKLRKKTIPTFLDPQRKPRYLETKKSQVQKMIESAEFDKEKFERIKEEEIKRFKQTSRDLSNTAFLTYFNRPPFQNYGRENKHSSGVLYGDYMYSHNVYPHVGSNHPKKQQSYISALTRAKSAGHIRPHPPMTRHLEEKMVSSYLTLSQIYPKDTSFQSIPIKNQTVLEKLPMFNYVRVENSRYKKNSPYINVNNNEDSLTEQNREFKRENFPKYVSNKDQFEGKQISYSKKIGPQVNYYE